MMTRRRFVTDAGGLLATAGMFPAALLARPIVLDHRAIDFDGGLNLHKLTALLHETFYVHTEFDGVVAVQLALVEERKPAGRRTLRRLHRTRLEQFSATFHGPTLPALPAGGYEVEHALTGRTLLALEPVGNATYRADFCLLP